MKKFISLMLVLFILAFSGCGKKPNVDTEADPKPDTTVNTQEQKDPFVAMMETDTRPVAIMIDNDGPSSRPQIGLESAYMIYEVIVEGGASRIMAIFKDASKIEKVGPVRSSRHYFLDYALEHDAIYCHAGWSPRAASDISTLGVNNVNGIKGDDGVNFYRDYTYDRTWHNLYTDLNKVYEYAVDKKGYDAKSDVTHTAYNDEDTDLADDAQPALEVELPYSTLYRVVYKYNEQDKNYTRYIGQKEHMSQTGDALTAKNIIICPIRNYPLQDGENKDRQEVETVGSGEGYYITNGKTVKIAWSKPSRTAKTVYTLESGEELKLNPGNTYVQIIPLSSTITIK